MDAVRSGDADAFDAWFRTEHPVVYRLCLGFLADPGEADDLAQDAMIQLHDRLGSFDPDRDWETWRTSVVLNLCRDRHRRRDARRRAEESEQIVQRGESKSLPDPGDRAQAGEVRQLVADSLSSLTEREREAFVLRDLVGHSTESTAELMGVRLSTVRSLLTVARRRLRDLLSPNLTPGGEHV